ncbi:MAG TPA: transferrin receptor-like dimerization domain-containing protein, partial [Terriglobales bacterium]|nr:transferrin receptor-like dimerization domain-containing protein [Terriglobales bacterium]
YSDPRDDGYFAGDVFPEGPMRPREGVQRGSVMDFPSSYPGNPVGGPDGDQHLAVKDAPSITKIPVLPLSYGDAQPLLAALRGPLAPREWRGALPITYHVGPGPAKVHLRVMSNWEMKKVYDVIARIPGAVEPEQWVVRGNHHDAWVNGAEDPVSGQVALLEEARALGQLLKQGWKPRRTILYCAWDGEEPMLLGSTAWGEAHADELRHKAVAYLNSDTNGRGYLFFSGSHILEHFLNAVARDIPDPESGLSVWKRHQLHDIAEARSAEERQELRQRPDLRLAALGSGTDYTVFLDHLGVPALNLGYGGEDPGGIYHSIYDDFYWYSHFSDTDFVYGRALAQTAGTAVLRLADAEVLPYEFTDLADTVHVYLKQLQELLKQQQEEVRERDRELDEGVFRAAMDPRRPTVAPAREEVPPHLDFAPLENAADALTRSAARYQKALAQARERAGAALPAASLEALNATLLESERKLTDPAGLPRRPWYQHMLYAPGVYTGYDVKTVPGVREAIEQKRWAEADSEILRVAKVLENEAALLDSATAELEALGK